MNDAEQVPDPWMKSVLRTAAIYNLVWGSWVILFPLASLRICGYPEPPTYPELWQCIGMIVGVYGIGYWFASSDPFRHWPVILVGFLGKILGPLGFVYSWMNGKLPASAGIVNIFNDVIWWVPFAVILWRAFRAEQVRQTTSETSLSFTEALESFRSQNGTSLAELSEAGPVLVLFLRHSGCTFCRESLAEVEQQRAVIQEAGVQITFVHMDREEQGRELFETYHVADLPRFSDPQQVLYRACGIGLGRFSQLMSWRVLWRGYLSAIVKRHGFSRVRSNVFRMPGTILLHHGKIIHRHVAQDASDHPDYANFVCQLTTPQQTPQA